MYILHTFRTYLLCTHYVPVIAHIVQIMYVFGTSVLCTHMYITLYVHMVCILHIDCNISISVHIMSIL